MLAMLSAGGSLAGAGQLLVAHPNARFSVQECCVIVVYCRILRKSYTVVCDTGLQSSSGTGPSIYLAIGMTCCLGP